MEAQKVLEILRETIADEITDYSLRGKLLNVIDVAIEKVPSNKKTPTSGFESVEEMRQQAEDRINRNIEEESDSPRGYTRYQAPSSIFGNSNE